MWDDSDNLAKIQNYIYLDKVTENLRKGSMPLEPACVGFKTIFKLSLEFKTEFSFWWFGFIIAPAFILHDSFIYVKRNYFKIIIL